MDDKGTGDSAFQAPITVNEAIKEIHEKRYLLPAIQREFVWTDEQVVKLFDSLMRGYTIGSFLYWKVEKEKLKDFQFYEFINNYDSVHHTHNQIANTTGEREITSILDGQQRLTSLYIALKGSYTDYIRGKSKHGDGAYPKKYLYLNILSKSEKVDMLYDFEFLTRDEAEKTDGELWFEVSKILEFNDLMDIMKYLNDNGLSENKFAGECLSKLYNAIKLNRVINYYLERSQELDKVLNMFIRVNSGGTKLSYSDLLLSTATAQWKNYDAKEVITNFVDDINHIGEGFYFSKDFILKSCLVLSDTPNIAFKVDNFKKDNMRRIEANWDEYSKSIRLSVKLISCFGYNSQTLVSQNAVIPIAYYLLQKGNPSNFVSSSSYKDDRGVIKNYFTVSLVKRIFGGQPDSILSAMRSIIKANHTSFPYKEIIEKYRGTNKSFIITDDEIENYLKYEYNSRYTFATLSLLYPTLKYTNKFHVDHIFPRSFFKTSTLKERGISEDDYGFYFENCDAIGNLQLMEGTENEEKSSQDFSKWFNKHYIYNTDRQRFMKDNLIPTNISLEFDNFREFITERNKLITYRLKTLLHQS